LAIKRKQDAENEKKRLKNFQLLADAQGIGYGSVDLSENFLSANQHMCDLFGAPLGGLDGKCILDFVANEEGKRKILEGTERRKK